MNVASNLKWLAVFQWTAKIFTSKISRTDPSALNRLFKNPQLQQCSVRILYLQQTIHM